MLDVVGVRHLHQGNVIELPGHRMFVDEACSGVNSLFVLFAATAVFVVAANRPLVWSALLLATSVFWAAVANTVRVTTIASAQSRYDVDLSSGWQHQTLGFTTVGLAMLMLVSTDRILAFLLQPIPLHDEGGRANPLSKIWNRCVAGEATKSMQAVTVEPPAERRANERPVSVVSKLARGLILVCFVMLADLQILANCALSVPRNPVSD
jgi:exosortase/archaeosortase family protein